MSLCYKSELMTAFFIGFLNCLSAFFRSCYSLDLEILALSIDSSHTQQTAKPCFQKAAPKGKSAPT